MRNWILSVIALGLFVAGCGKDEPEVPEPPPRDEAIEEAHDDAISAIIKEGKAPIKLCGTAEKTGGEAVKGKVNVTFVIQADGKVGAVKLEENSSGSQTAADCVMAIIKSWEFAAHPYGDEIEYTYPFEVLPEAPAAEEPAATP